METTQSRFGYNDKGSFVDLATGLPPTAEDHERGDKAYYAMLEAESTFETALVKKYGRRATEMRYRTNDLPQDIRDLAIAMQNAVETWRATWRATEVK